MNDLQVETAAMVRALEALSTSARRDGDGDLAQAALRALLELDRYRTARLKARLSP